MFEGLVRQLLVGYLGRYIKDIHRDQLKITLWNEEVLLENVELILEAFDYLQLPFALKQGRVGKLSIKIPWKKLGWDPIIIVLEDLYVCAAQRGDEEWSLDAVERREFAGKKAKLAAAELAKLSRRVCDNHTGKSFVSFITAKILDNIQVSIQNFHVLYHDVESVSGQIVLGLRLSRLTIVRQQPLGSLSGWTRGGLVNKVVDIVGLEIYCHTSRDAADKISIESLGDSKLWANERLSSNDRDSILAPCDVSMSLSVSRSGKLDNSSPQYSISAELTGLVFSLDELQLQQILVLWDYLCTCQLRDRYGRFRPWGSPISKRIRGWQILWWHYAQESVLSDVRKKLKKTSWRYLGQRLSYRRKYVNLYKIKLEFLQLDQSVDENILEELEEMEKESEIDDILSYRSAAESELQHLFYSPTTRNGITGLHTSVEKSRIDDRLIGRSRGWLNWLSRGMLGAGGTDDSSQFSGVVSDEIIEDIYEATKFQPLVSSIGDVTEDLIEDDKVCSRAIKFGIEQISATLWSRKYGQEVTEMIFNGTIVECRLSEESATISVLVNSVEILNPCNRNVVVMINKPINEKDLDTERTSNTFQVHVSPSHEILSPSHEIDLSVKVMIRPVEVTYDTQFFRCFIEFFDGFRSFEFLHERVLSSLDGIGNVNARLLSKAKYILSNRKTVMWDISIINVTINVPWTNANFEQPNLVLELGALLLTSKHNPGSPSSSVKENLFTLKNLNASVSSYEFSLPLQLEDIYDHFEVKLNDIEMKITIPSHSKRISMFEKFNASISLGTCLIPDQLLVKQLEVFLILSPLRAYFSPSTYEAVLGLIASQFDRSSNPSYMISETDGPHPLTLKEHKNPVFGFSVCASLQSVSFQVNLENGGENSYALLLVLEELEAWYALTEVEECRICIKELNITVHPIRGKGDRHTLFSCGTHSPITSSSEIQNNVGREGVTDKNMSTKSCFLLHYESHTANVIHPKGTIHLNNAEIHCYPYVIGLLIGFYERLLRCSTLFSSENSCTPLMNAENTKLLPTLGFQRFGFSNFFEVGSSEYTSIPTDCFPFVTIQNKGFLGNIESSLVYTNSDWRKHLETKDGKMFIPEAGVNRGLPSIASGSSCQTNVCVIELNFCGIRVHFHDSSSIIGSITLPTSKSSILICEDYMDMLCSTEGLILSSPWWTKNLRNFLWGPSLPCLSPVLNVRLRSLNSQQEISISVQHVYCILPPEYLAIIIGYFSLPDWVNTNEQFGSQGSGYKDSEEDIMYKFEILDSLLIFPTESNELQFLKFEISQLCCSFFMGTSSNDALKDIPSEYLVPIHKVATSNRCLNMFGQDLFLSFLLFKDGISDCSMFDHSTECRDISLVASLSADLWVRIPDMNASVQNSGAATCIMTRIHTCEVVADDCHMVGGFEALAEIINQLSFVEDCSKCFKSDVLQYFQLQRCLKEKSAPPTISSSVSSAEIRCCANSLFLKMHRYSKGKTEVISEVEMQFTCLASFENNNILMLDISFASLQLYSRKKSVVLARFSSVSSILLALNICLSKSSEGENELHVCLPSADVWLHLSEWNEVLDLFNSFSGQVANSSAPDSILVNLESESIDPLINSAVSSLPDDLHSSNRSACLASENMERDSLVLILRSNNVGITLHLPVSAREPCRELLVGEVEHKSPQGRSSYIEVTLHSREIEVFVNGRAITLKYDIKMLRGLISLSEDKHVQSWPFIQIFEVYLEADIICNPIVPLYVKSRVQFDRFDLWLSHHVFSFWYDLHYDIPEVGSSHPATLCGIELEIQGRKASVLLSDGRWSFCGPLLEILVKNIHFCASVNENSMEDFITGELQVNYNNIQKVFWEPFIEPWLFEMNVIRKNQSSTLLNSSVMTDIRVVSSLQLNLNITESLVECIARADEMVRDAWGMSRPNDATESQKLLNFPFDGNISTGSYAPYILQNLTSLPLLYHVYQGQGNLDEFDVSDFKEENRVWPATSIPIYINESPEEQLFHLKSSHSFERLTMLKTNGDAHHFISIQLDGTSVPSIPISIDLVGRRYFEVDFLKPPENEIDLPGNVSKDNENIEENLTDASGGFIIPVVIDVSVQRYSKLVRLYSTVILFNTTSVPLELRFDIPFGVSPMVLDPLYPGQEVPLPLHLAEAGRMRWRPIGSSYLWSEAYNLSNLLSHENKVGLFRSFVCYPSHPSSDPFRCCMSVRNIVLPSVVISKKMMSDLKKSVTSCGQAMRNLTEAGKRSIHQVTLSTPLVVKNHLPKELQLTVDTGGIKHTAILSEVETFFHHVDPLHDLALEIHMQGFRPSAVRLPRAETFCAKAKFGGTKYSLSETITFNPDLSNGPIYITMEKAIDAFSGARELSIFVPFLLYNCTGIPLLISESVDELRGVSCIIPSCYDRVEQELVLGKRDGLRALTSSHDSHSIDPDGRISFSIKNIVSTIEDANPHSGKLPQKCLSSSSCLSKSYEQSNKNKSECQNFFASTFQDRSSATPRLNTRDSNFVECEHGKVRPCMFSPNPDSPANEVVVRAGRPVFESGTENMPSSSRSSPFSLIPPNGSTTILVPQSSPNSAFIISVTTSAVSGPFSEKINAITFQPRYVISNACSRDLYYKQKGTDFIFKLGIGEHSHLHWMDTTRELLVSVLYEEPGWQWSGGFLPDHLGDTQLKMRNFVSAALNIIRVEVQNVDVSLEDEQIVGSLHGNSGTNLILLSDDDTGYMPYRIDNFSKERLQIYQTKCEPFETIVHSYTSCPYAWDEPSYPHRLTVEVPGERVLGSYALDDVKEYMPVNLPSTSEKPARILYLSVHAEGATKVLSIIDSTYHIPSNSKDPSAAQSGEKRKNDEKQDNSVDYKEKITVVIPYIGLSFISSYPEELVFACAKDMTIDLLQSLDRQKFSLKLLSLQIDNQLRNTPYPVILSFDLKYKSNLAGNIRNKDVGAMTRSERMFQITSDSFVEPVFYLAASKWRKKDISLVSFEHISLRVADFFLELEQELILCLFEFLKNVASRFQNKLIPFSDPSMCPLIYDSNRLNESSSHKQTCECVNARKEHLRHEEVPIFNENNHISPSLLPSVVPIGAPWQQIYLLARKQKKIYVELFNMAPITVTLSFSSAPWTLRDRVVTSGELLIHRGLMALADIEGAQIHLKQLTITHHMASWGSIQEIIIRHYMRQLLHEMYKVFGSAGVIGNPMGFARSLGVGIRDFLSVPAKGILQSPTGLVTGMAQGTSSLLSNTVYAISDAATQFSKAAHKGIVAFTFDDQSVSRLGMQQMGVASRSEGVISEVLEAFGTAHTMVAPSFVDSHLVDIERF